MAGKDEIGKVENWETKARGLLNLIQIVSVPSVVKWFGLYRGSGGKDEIGESRKLGN